jgi:hypothetical protein
MSLKKDGMTGPALMVLGETARAARAARAARRAARRAAGWVGSEMTDF